MKKNKPGTLARNKRASYDYFLEEHYEAGLELKGTEVKSIRQGKVSLNESFCIVKNGEVFIEGMNVTPYEQGNRFNVDPLRTRKLLLHRREIAKLERDKKLKGHAIVPISLYLKNGRVKLSIASGRGKKNYDKRESIKEREVDRKIRRSVDR
ncbi:MAG: SsrA-binding protein SmpB [Tissierellia bacterium]|nr:SsrA-binding protein SmpB [Tissierellia bacterium]